MTATGYDSSPLEPGDLCQSSDQRDRGQIVIVAEVGIEHVSGDTVRVLLTNGRAVYRLRRLLVACHPRTEDGTPETQACRDCGETFPYDADADYCPACVAANNPPQSVRVEQTRTMAKKVRRGRQHAKAALHGYRSAILTDPRAGNPDSDELALLGDLLADLLHLADEIAGEYDATQDTPETVDRIVRTAKDHHRYESDPANADEAV